MVLADVMRSNSSNTDTIEDYKFIFTYKHNFRFYDCKSVRCKI